MDHSENRATDTSNTSKMDWRYGLELASLTLIYFLSSKIGLFLEVEYGGITPIWPPSGIAAAVFWVRGMRYWPMVIVGEFFIALSIGQPPLAGIIGGLAQTLEASLVIVLLRNRRTTKITSSARSMLWFSLLGVLIPPLFSSLIGSSTLWALGFLNGSEYFSGLLTWWLGDAVGILVITPILVDLDTWPIRDPSTLFYYAFFTVFTVAICLVIIILGSEKSYYLFFILIPFVVVSAVHFTLVGAGSNAVLLAIIVFGMRPQDLVQGDFITIIRMAFVGTCAFTGYLVTGFMEKRKHRMDIINRQNSYLNTLNEVVLGLIGHLEINHLLEAIVSHACELLNTEDGYLYRHEKNSNTIKLIVGSGIYGDVLGYQVNPNEGVAGKVLKSGKALMINNYQDWEGRHPDKIWDSVNAIIGVPIKVNAEVVGVLGMLHKEKNTHFSNDDLAIIERFGELASVAWKNALIYQELSDQLTARMRAEQALAVSEKTHREIFNSTGEAVFVLDIQNGLIARANKAAEEMFGHSDLTNKSFYALVKESGLPYSEKDLKSFANHCMEKGPQVFEWYSNNKKGSGTWFEITLKKALIKDVMCILAVARNIDDRKKAEAHLKQLQTAIDFVVEDIMITDVNGLILYVNPGFERVTGYTRTEVLGKKPGILNSGAQSKEFYTDLWRTILSGKVWTGRFKNRCKDGSIIIQDASLAPIRDEENEIVGFVSVKRDITEHEQIKQQLFKAQKMEAIGTLASGIAHDFNNILAGIIGYSELALNFHLPPDSPAAEDVQLILRAGKRATDLVKQILTFSHSTELELKPVDVKPIAKEVFKFISSSLPPTIEINADISAEHSMVLATPTNIHQILMNLVTNAMQAIPDEKGRIDMRLSNLIIKSGLSPVVDSLKPGEYLEISVSDTGSGMEKETIEKIFEPYFTTKAPGKGTGLGLSVVHGIVQTLGGSILVESDTDLGTTFRIFLAVSSATMKKDTKDEHKLPTGDESILFIDDNPLLTDITRQLLNKLGYKVSIFADSNVALNHFNKDPNAFDLVISDNLMPKMTGIELVEEMKHIRPEIPVIICTGNPNKISPADVEKIGISEVAKKPLDLNELAVLIREVLEK